MSGLISVSLVSASGRGIGLLCVADKQAGDSAQNDERALVQLADLAAVGLANARFHEETEARVRRRTQELEESNPELEAFSYSVSHDLRGPLRAIAGFTGLLRDRHYETIDADGRRYIDRVLAGTQRMSNLIDDLLIWAGLRGWKSGGDGWTCPSTRARSWRGCGKRLPGGWARS